MRRLLILTLALIPVLTAGTGADAASEKKKGGGDSFLQFPIMTATLNMGGGRRGVLTVETGLDVPDGGLRARADSLQPRLRDAYVRYLVTYAASVTPGTPPDPDAIGAALQRATDQVLGKPGARLLLGTVLEN
jgi:hypothetical protein